MPKFRGAVLTCVLCETQFKVPPSRAHKAEYCSLKCASVGRGQAMRKRTTITCEECGKPFEIHTCHIDRHRFCSKKCMNTSPVYRSEQSLARMGEKNGMWKGGTVNHSEGYIYRAAPNHPFASNSYVFEHRLVIEAWLRENDPTSKYLIPFGNSSYLTPDCVVHHKDEDKTNNRASNLECMSIKEHMYLHAQMKRQSSL